MEFPSVQRYLERLPRGLASYPQCQVKASVLVDALSDKPLARLTGLEPALVELAASPPPVSSFIPEAHFVSLMLAIYDTHFGGSDDAAYLEWVYQRNRLLLQKPLYRVLFMVASPERLLRGAASRWSAFRKGTSIELVEEKHRWAAFVVRYPPHLYADLVLASMGSALRAAATAAGAQQARSSVEPGPVSCRVILEWD